MTGAPSVTQLKQLYTDFHHPNFNEPLKGMEAVCFPQRGLGTSVFPQVCGHMNDKTVVLSSVFI